MENLSNYLAEQLLDIKAVSFSPDEPATWASGLKAPMYCDNRKTLAYPQLRKAITDGFVTLIREEIGTPNVIVGTATAGIPQAAWVADALNLPMAYVRSEAKAHGKGNQIEGDLKKGQTAVIVEDLISTGGSVMKVVAALRNAGIEVLGVVAIFSYGFEETEALFIDSDVPFYTLTDMETLLEVVELNGVLRYTEIEDVRDWQEDPRSWSDQQED